MLKVKILRQVRQKDLQIRFSERLAKADATATIEGHKASWVSFPSLWSQTELMAVVKAFGEEFKGSLPLIAVEVKSVERIDDHIAL